MGTQRLHDFRVWMQIWLVKILFAQLFLTLFSLPIIIWWGLPLSVLTIIGNVIFNPCIGLFLLIATILFFCTLCGLPTWYLACALNRISEGWLWLVAQGTPHALVAVPKLPAIVLVGITCCTLLIMYRFRYQQVRGIVAFSAILLGIFLVVKWQSFNRVSADRIPYGGKHLWVISEDGTTCLIDDEGVLRAGEQNLSWVDFTLRPHLVKVLGCVACDALIIIRPTYARVQAACILAKKVRAPYVIVPEEKTYGERQSLYIPEGVVLRHVPEKMVQKIYAKPGVFCMKNLWYSIKHT